MQVATSLAVRHGVLWPWRALATSAASSSATDQMITYAVQQCKGGQHNQASDVLRSGLSMQPQNQGTECARLWTTMASVEADRNNWKESLSCAVKGQAALAGILAGGKLDAAQASAYVAASRLAVSSHLVQGEDADGMAMATACADSIPPTDDPPTRAGGLALLLSSAHATGQAGPGQAAADQLGALLAADRGRLPDSCAPSTAEDLVAAHTSMGDWHSRQGGSKSTAHAAYVQACSIGDTARQGATSGSLLFDERTAAALMGTAQLAMADGQWDTAEEVLGKALAAVEGISGDKHARVVPVLVLLGYVYSRSARVTFAEGMFREAAKMLKVDATAAIPHLTTQLAHPSLVAVLAWRTSQLMHALPNRGREAEAWAAAAQQCWAGSRQPIESVLGTSGHLKGEGEAGSGVLLSLPVRRALPLAL